MLIIPYRPLGANVTEGLGIDLNQANWPKWAGMVQDGQSYPQVAVYLSHSSNSLDLYFKVTDWDVMATMTQDQDPVWQESCVELFVRPCGPAGEVLGPEGYYNFEFNALGTCLSYFGPQRHGRSPLPTSVLSQIERKSSLGSAPFAFQKGPLNWSLEVKIPLGSFVYHHLSSFDGQFLAFNLYKCGDSLPAPHYLSWRAIASAEPDFHRPEFFGLAQCAKEKD